MPMTEREFRHAKRYAAWLFEEGFLIMRMRDGEEVYAMIPDILNATQEQYDLVETTIKDAGPTGCTSKEVAERTGLSLPLVRHIIGDTRMPLDWRRGLGR
jgi:hypothetical protein